MAEKIDVIKGSDGRVGIALAAGEILTDYGADVITSTGNVPTVNLRNAKIAFVVEPTYGDVAALSKLYKIVVVITRSGELEHLAELHRNGATGVLVTTGSHLGTMVKEKILAYA